MTTSTFTPDGEPSQAFDSKVKASMEGSKCRICGSWFKNNHARAGHRTQVHSEEEIKEAMLDALAEMGEELGRLPEARDMEQDGPYSQNTYQNRFGSWNNAVEKAGFEPQHIFDRKTVECTNCGADIEKCYRRAKRHTRHFCDSSCMGEWQEKNWGGEGNPRYTKSEVDCANCGETLLRADWQFETNENHFCDFSCLGEYWQETGVRTGPNSPVWEGGDTVYGNNWDERREEVLERDGYECQACGRSQSESESELGCDLHVHHRQPIREFDDPEVGNRLSNLVTLCQSCHMKWEHLPVQIEVPTAE
jgi:5-methylcytosine-specific restriction endonuclease McrA